MSSIVRYSGPFLKSFVALPAPELRAYIDTYEGEEFYAPTVSSLYGPRLLRLPAGFTELTLCYHDTSYLLEVGKKRLHLNSIIEGEHDIRTLFFVEECPKVNYQVHVKFKPGGFCEFFGIRDGELRNSFFSSEEVLGSQTRELEDRLNGLLTADERVEILNRFFVKKLCCRRREACVPPAAAAVKIIIACKGRLRIADVARELSVSNRTIEREFMSRIGLSPKELSRIVRFKSVLNELISADKVDWFELVRSHGYYDQSHLIEEFRMATTFSPEAFWEQRGSGVVKFRGFLFLLREPQESRDRALQGTLRDAMRSETKNIS